MRITENHVKKVSCRVDDISLINDDVYYVRLISNKWVPFKAGQYLNILCQENKAAFSIASSPMERDYLELHLGAFPNNKYAVSAINRLLDKNDVEIEIPNGSAWFKEESNRPLLLIAGGTGYSYIRSILITALILNPQKMIAVYWGGKQAYNLYDLHFLLQLCDKYKNLSIQPIVEQTDDQEKVKRTGLVLDAVLADNPSLTPFDIYIAGPFEMAKIARERFCKEAGAIESQIFSDAYSFL